MNRIKSFFAVILLITASTASAQIYWGPKGSLQTYKTSFFDKEVKDTLDSKFRIGFTLGGFVNVPLKDHYSLTAELSYVRRGRKNIISVDGQELTHISQYNFLELPMMLRREFEVTIKENMRSAWYLQVGPNISYWMGGKGKFTKGAARPFSYDLKFGSPDATTDDVMFIQGANRFMFGLEVGAGIHLQTRGMESVGIELRYTHGQTFLGKKDSRVTLSNEFLTFRDNIKSNYRVIGIDVCYNFMLNVREFKKGASVSDKRKKVKKRKR